MDTRFMKVPFCRDDPGISIVDDGDDSPLSVFSAQ
jgi:hypothetical protein